MKSVAFLIVGLAMMASVAGAATIVETWDSGTQGWNIDDGEGGSAYGGLSAASLGGQDALRIGGGDADPFVNVDYIFANSSTSGSFIDGDGQTDFSNFIVPGGEVQGLSFDFYANAGGPGGNLPSALRLYFETDGVTWYHNITGVTSGWGTYSASISTVGQGSWYTQGADIGAAWDVSQVSEIGLYLQYQSNLGGQEYGLDNFTMNYAVPTPEPGTVAMLAMAFGSLGVTFRKKLRETMSSVKESLAA